MHLKRTTEGSISVDRTQAAVVREPVPGKTASDPGWLGWQDSNLRMAVPKTAALPLGDTPSPGTEGITGSA